MPVVANVLSDANGDNKLHINFTWPTLPEHKLINWLALPITEGHANENVADSRDPPSPAKDHNCELLVLVTY